MAPRNSWPKELRTRKMINLHYYAVAYSVKVRMKWMKELSS